MTKSLLSVVIILLSAIQLVAQPKFFTGSITYKLTYPSSATGPLASALPSSVIMQISGNKARFELTLPNGKQTFIVNGDEISITRLMDIKEGKFYIKKTREEFLNEEPPTVMALKETKSVAGYACKSAEISAKDRGGKVQKSKVFYSEELGNNNIYFNTIAKGVKGILLDFDYNGMMIPMHMTATEITPGRISNKTFEIPSDYKETTEAKLQQMRQANKSK